MFAILAVFDTIRFFVLLNYRNTKLKQYFRDFLLRPKIFNSVGLTYSTWIFIGHIFTILLNIKSKQATPFKILHIICRNIKVNDTNLWWNSWKLKILFKICVFHTILIQSRLFARLHKMCQRRLVFGGSHVCIVHYNFRYDIIVLIGFIVWNCRNCLANSRIFIQQSLRFQSFIFD